MERQKEIMESWYGVIGNFKKLKINEAQELTKKMLNSNGEEKNKIREKLIHGTLYLIYNFVQKSGFDAIYSSYFDLDDIFSSCCEEWIEIIDSGRLLSVDRYSLLFSSSFYNSVTNRLVQDKTLYVHNMLLSDTNFARLFQKFLKDINIGKEVNHSNIIEYIKHLEFYHPYYSISVVELELVLKNIYEIVDDEKIEGISRTKLSSLKYLLLELSCIDKRYDLEQYKSIDTIEELCNQIVYEEINKFILERSNLTDKEKEIIKLRYGMEDGHTLTLGEIANKYKLTRERIKQLENRAIKKLRYPKNNLQKYLN